MQQRAGTVYLKSRRLRQVKVRFCDVFAVCAHCVASLPERRLRSLTIYAQTPGLWGVICFPIKRDKITGASKVSCGGQLVRAAEATGMSISRLVSWSGTAESTMGGAANATQDKFLIFESRREAFSFY